VALNTITVTMNYYALRWPYWIISQNNVKIDDGHIEKYPRTIETSNTLNAQEILNIKRAKKARNLLGYFV
jgi:hypothetical protein